MSYSIFEKYILAGKITMDEIYDHIKNGRTTAQQEAYRDQLRLGNITDFAASEIVRTIKSGYQSVGREDSDEIGYQRAEGAESTGVKNESPIYNYANFNDEIFSKLPRFLQGYDLITKNNIQRDIILISNLAILSACFPDVFTIHDGARSYVNLFFLIYAPPASNKGKMSTISKIAEPLDKLLSEDCAKRKKAFNISCKACGKDNNCLDNLEEAPKCKGLFLDADSSTIAMIQALDQGKESLLMDSEATVLSQNRRNDWSQLDPLLRKAYHFERISVSRRDKIITIRDPRISMLISGTVEDAKVFSGTVKGGLASRILPYSFRTPMEWLSPFSEESQRIPEFIDVKATELIHIYKYSKAFPFEFKLSEAQQQLHTDRFKGWTEELDNEDVFAFLKRLGIATVRIAMILTALRRTEMNNHEAIVFCDDDLFDIALSIADTFRNQGIEFYRLLSENSIEKQPKAYVVLKVLPKRFKTHEFIDMAKKLMMINTRQAKFHLHRLVDQGNLINVSHGTYDQA